MYGTSNTEATEAISLILGAMAEAHRQLDSSIANGIDAAELRAQLSHAVGELSFGLDHVRKLLNQ